MKQINLIIAAGFAGFVGGILGTHIMQIHDQSNPAQVIRARSFELVDKTGEVISYWGIDKGQNIVLAFGGLWPDRPNGKRPLPGNPLLGLKDPENQLASIGVIGNFPLLQFRGEDGKPRARLLTSMNGKPTLLMDDETGPRLSLGIDQSDTPGPDDNDWALVFAPERVWLGMHSWTEHGQTYVQGGFSVKRNKLEYPNRPIK